MEIRIISDVHNEFRNEPLKIPIFGDEKQQILIIAGDFSTLKNIKNLRSELLEYTQRFYKVLYLYGNHEFYGFKLDYKRAKTIINELELPENFHLLNRYEQPVEINDFVVIGATLWTDFNRDKFIEYSVSEKMNDFKKITYIDKSYSGERYTKFKTKYWFKEFIEDFTYIKNEVIKHKDKKVIIVSHHAPSLKSSDERFSYDEEGKYAYASNLEEYLESLKNVKYWFHGHVHVSKDYNVGDVRVVANPFGYINEFGKDIDLEFKLKLTLPI